jgi:hypothetical protein
MDNSSAVDQTYRVELADERAFAIVIVLRATVVATGSPTAHAAARAAQFDSLSYSML